GIRDPLVTGVQTCALPISQARRPHARIAGTPDSRDNARRAGPPRRGRPARALRVAPDRAPPRVPAPRRGPSRPRRAPDLPPWLQIGRASCREGAEGEGGGW